MSKGLLRFGKGNAKLDVRVLTFSLPAGRTCPGASECKSMAVEKNNKRTIKDGPNTVFRCFAASQEVLYKNTYKARTHNLALLKAARGKGIKAALIIKSLPKSAKYVRVHVSGDFFSQDYFNAWMTVASLKPDVLFYAYTKSLPYWVEYLNKNTQQIPGNFVLTASVGGRYDPLIARHDLRYARVVYSTQEANALGLEIDTDDTHAMSHGPSFTLLLHGTQPEGSEAAKALGTLKKAGKGGYSAKKKKKKATLPVI